MYTIFDKKFKLNSSSWYNFYKNIVIFYMLISNNLIFNYIVINARKFWEKFELNSIISRHFSNKIMRKKKNILNSFPKSCEICQKFPLKPYRPILQIHEKKNSINIGLVYILQYQKCILKYIIPLTYATQSLNRKN